MENVSSFLGKPCVFIAGAFHPQAFPPPCWPEIAFVGRSNVGKSSLLNALLGRRALARVSKTPGRTQQINFFCLDQVLYLVDLPGYGYARVSHQTLQAWENLIITYLQKRPTLQRVYLLIDSRHGLKSSDQLMVQCLEGAHVPYQLILTKIDKTPRSILAERVETLEKIAALSQTALPSVIATSASQKQGLDDLRKDILSFLTSCK